MNLEKAVFMNNICVFAKNKSTYFVRRIMEEAPDRVALFNPWADVNLPVADTYLVRTTGVYHSDLDLLILSSLPADKIVNTLPVLKRFRGKCSQYQWMESCDIPVPPWVYLNGLDQVSIEKFFRLYPKGVVKPNFGQGGWGIEAMSWERYRSWARKRAQDQDYLLQQFISSAVEYRIFFIRGLCEIVLKRHSPQSLAANFRAGGAAQTASLPSPLRPVVDEVIHKSQAHYGAIDVLEHDGSSFVLEVNAVPGIEQLESISGQNVIKLILQSL